jgi:hypothetical protein
LIREAVSNSTFGIYTDKRLECPVELLSLSVFYLIVESLTNPGPTLTVETCRGFTESNLPRYAVDFLAFVVTKCNIGAALFVGTKIEQLRDSQSIRIHEDHLCLID